MSFKIIFKDAKSFAKVLNYSAEFDKTTAIVIVDPDCFHMQSMDSSHTSINDLKLPPSYFESFEVMERIKLGLPLEFMYDFIKNVKHEKVTLTSEKGYISLSAVSMDGFEASMQLRTINMESEMFDIPEDMESNCTLQVDINTLKKWASFLPKKGSVKFTPEKQQILVESQTDQGTCKLCEPIHYANFKNPNSVQVSSVVMDKIYKMMQFGSDVGFEIVNDAPFQASVDIGTGVRMYSYFAPMIEDEMEM